MSFFKKLLATKEEQAASKVGKEHKKAGTRPYRTEAECVRDAYTKEELYFMGKALGAPVKSKMNKDELCAALTGDYSVLKDRPAPPAEKTKPETRYTAMSKQARAAGLMPSRGAAKPPAQPYSPRPQRRQKMEVVPVPLSPVYEQEEPHSYASSTRGSPTSFSGSPQASPTRAAPTRATPTRATPTRAAPSPPSYDSLYGRRR